MAIDSFATVREGFEPATMSRFRVSTPNGFVAESDALHALCGDEIPTRSDQMLSNALSDEQGRAASNQML
jgi:hypothetical protein